MLAWLELRAAVLMKLERREDAAAVYRSATNFSSPLCEPVEPVGGNVLCLECIAMLKCVCVVMWFSSLGWQASLEGACNSSSSGLYKAEVLSQAYPPGRQPQLSPRGAGNCFSGTLTTRGTTRRCSGRCGWRNPTVAGAPTS